MQRTSIGKLYSGTGLSCGLCSHKRTPIPRRCRLSRFQSRGPCHSPISRQQHCGVYLPIPSQEARKVSGNMKFIQRHKSHSEKFRAWQPFSSFCWDDTGGLRSWSWKIGLSVNHWRWYSRSQRHPQQWRGIG
jgi:hypothetical protein